MKCDPIFALIEAARKSDAEFQSVVSELGPIEQRLWALGLTSAQERKHPDMVAYYKRYNPIQAASGRAMRRVCNCKPTTPEGLYAFLEYMKPLLEHSFIGEFEDGRTDNFTDTLLGAVHDLAQKADAKPLHKPVNIHAIAAE
jgi:hypothetical protein